MKKIALSILMVIMMKYTDVSALEIDFKGNSVQLETRAIRHSDKYEYFFFAVSINGNRYLFLFDSTAEKSLIDDGIAEKLNLKKVKENNDEIYSAENIQIGDLKIKDLMFIGRPLTEEIRSYTGMKDVAGILGREIMGDHILGMDFIRRKTVLYKKDSIKYTEDSVTVNMIKNKGYYSINMIIDGKNELSGVLSTMFPESLCININTSAETVFFKFHHYRIIGVTAESYNLNVRIYL